MPYMIVRQTVRDFDKWESEFQKVLDKRKEAGEKGYHIYRGIDDPNQVTAVYEMEDLDKAREFAHSEVVTRAVQEATIEGVPEISFYDEVDASSYI